MPKTPLSKSPTLPQENGDVHPSLPPLLKGPGIFIGVLLLAMLVISRVVALDTVPPGLYNDEASIGYNAWAVSHYGVDEHGTSWPLFFQAFGEYKSPVYVYMVALLTRFSPLTPTVERLPAALLGILTVVMMTAIAYCLSKRRWVAALALIVVAVQPWLFVESRFGVEVMSMVACLCASLWCVVRAMQAARSSRWYGAAGIFLGVALFSYPTARLFVAMVVLIMVWAFVSVRPRIHGWVPMVAPVAVAYGVMAAWLFAHPGAFSERLAEVGITADHPPLLTVISRFVSNYLSYVSFPFLFIHGDPQPRHSTGYGGMLLVAIIPLLLAGIWKCITMWRRSALVRITVVGILAAPIPAALTMEATPHSLRAATMLLFIFLLVIYGLMQWREWLTHRRIWLTLLTAVIMIETAGFMADYFGAYPARVYGYFDGGEGPTLLRAIHAAHGHRIWISKALDPPGIQVAFYTLPDPEEYAPRQLGLFNMRRVAPTDFVTAVSSGDILVTLAHEAVPTNAKQLFTDNYVDTSSRPTKTVTLMRVYEIQPRY